MRYNIEMMIAIRRIGNSLGVIIPRSTLAQWGVAEGDCLELDRQSIHPRQVRNASELLDEVKYDLALAVVRGFTPREIRAKSLANLRRWKRAGVWVSAYDEWESIMRDPDDGALYGAMLGRDETSTRLRQSMPYAGLLPRDEVQRINEKAAR
jgi:antitoxin component of MazEF toxin-antitoxin module